MQYRCFGKLDWKVSALGFGTMRLPLLSNSQADVNIPETVKLIRYAIDQGVNYIDSAYVYHDGNSERAIGQALQEGYRKKVKVATKMPTFSIHNKSQLDDIFEEQLARLQTDCIDFYLMHSLTGELWKKVQEFGMLDWAEKQVANGRIGYLGFSFHDEFEVFKEIIDSYDGWTFCQIQYNYLDENHQAGKAGLKYAASKGLAVVVMEPLAGGLLAVNPPLDIQKEMQKAEVKRSPPDWGLQWIWNQPEVSVALSGMNALQQVQDNLQYANHSAPNSLTKQELAILSNAKKLFEQSGYIGCTKCHYCIHCPQSIDIPLTLAFLNQYSIKRREPEVQEQIKKQYQQAASPEKRASNCLHCGQCEAICPQHLPVRKLLSEASASLE